MAALKDCFIKDEWGKLMDTACKKVKYVIYGASSGGKKVFNTLKSFGIDIAYFVDGNEKLWAQDVLGKKVCSPDILVGEDCKIIIASDFGYSAIKNKLTEMGVETKCILKEEVIKNEINKLSDSQNENKNRKTNNNRTNNKTVFIELIEGVQLGGVENWTHMIAGEFYNKKMPVEVLAGYKEEYVGEWGEYYNDSFPAEYINYKKCVFELLDYMEHHLPCVIILNKQQQLYYAAYMLKQLYPNDVTICSIMHSDIEAYYVRQNFIKNDVDYIFCVSKNISDNLQLYGIERDKILYKETPILFSVNSKEHKYTKKDEPIKIAFGGRLETVAKRADLLFPLIESLEELDIKYKLAIAGEGQLWDRLNAYVKQQSLERKVVLLGMLPHSKMQEFWMDADIFISLSEFEGMPISMLEAMKCGAVPVVTDVLGNREFIDNGVNGYILPIGDYMGIADKIAYLYTKREKIAYMGQKSNKIVTDRCNIDDYIDFFKVKLSIGGKDEQSNSVYAGL